MEFLDYNRWTSLTFETSAREDEILCMLASFHSFHDMAGNISLYFDLNNIEIKNFSEKSRILSKQEIEQKMKLGFDGMDDDVSVNLDEAYKYYAIFFTYGYDEENRDVKKEKILVINGTKGYDRDISWMAISQECHDNCKTFDKFASFKIKHLDGDNVKMIIDKNVLRQPLNFRQGVRTLSRLGEDNGAAETLRLIKKQEEEYDETKEGRFLF